MGSKFNRRVRSIEKVIVVELAGIPYARKTSILFDMENLLKGSGFTEFRVVGEYRGDLDTYDLIKIGSTINVKRALFCAKAIREECVRGKVKVILFDRGVWDSIVWLEHFVRTGEASTVLRDIRSKARVSRMLDVCIKKVERYCVIWIDEDPLIANARHNRQGKIINLSNLVGLSEEYRSAHESNDQSKLISIRVRSMQKDNLSIAESALQRVGIFKASVGRLPISQH